MATCFVHRAARIVFRTNAPTERLTTLDGRLAAAAEKSEVGDGQKEGGWEEGCVQPIAQYVNCNKKKKKKDTCISTWLMKAKCRSANQLKIDRIMTHPNPRPLPNVNCALQEY